MSREERRLGIWTREGVECEPDKPAYALDLAEGIAGQVLGVILFGFRGEKLSLDPLLYLHRQTHCSCEDGYAGYLPPSLWKCLALVGDLIGQ